MICYEGSTINRILNALHFHGLKASPPVLGTPPKFLNMPFMEASVPGRDLIEITIGMGALIIS